MMIVEQKVACMSSVDEGLYPEHYEKYACHSKCGRRVDGSILRLIVLVRTFSSCVNSKKLIGGIFIRFSRKTQVGKVVLLPIITQRLLHLARNYNHYKSINAADWPLLWA